MRGEGGGAMAASRKVLCIPETPINANTGPIHHSLHPPPPAPVNKPGRPADLVSNTDLTHPLSGQAVVCPNPTLNPTRNPTRNPSTVLADIRLGHAVVLRPDGCALRSGFDIDSSALLCRLPQGFEFQYDHEQILAADDDDVVDVTRLRVVMQLSTLRQFVMRQRQIQPSGQFEQQHLESAWREVLTVLQDQEQRGLPGHAPQGHGQSHRQSQGRGSWGESKWVCGWVSDRGRTVEDHDDLVRIFSRPSLSHAPPPPHAPQRLRD